ncbi:MULTISPECIES: SMI1/KNR4 family protein [Serratia]|uniref:SMI1/KNR4 family protein n=1 Tax=Serratia TaxID=613 RepID=UPI0005341271|nr:MULTISPECIES: SMI1/KNR4 family protein [Serratia]ELY1863623.1 SMI1/KNR4 family protein [Serratia marcescens]ELY1865561.1 SMI1/KNR4 family protein [Serratia marcescens]MBN5336130.1 SMI1/KNR4 family protein [Serratia marcescens]MBN5340519.1 SMI1/KNR4 family protein [Serratia marcescens]MCW7559107.1 SMI1/KNR4 family protein [Serratia marcescens]
MKQLWEKMEAILQDTDPDLLADLGPPATDEDIATLEQALGLSLPADFVACMKIHNGQHGISHGLFDECEFLSTSRIIQEWRIWKGLLDGGDFEGAESCPQSGIRPEWWSPAWIPFTYNGAGDHLCIDLAPTDVGIPGQIITLWHDDGVREKQADSFIQWFTQYVEQM